MHKDGANIGQMCMVSTFSEYTIVPDISCVKIPDDIPFEAACLVGCGVPTGWGSAVYGAGVEPGDVTIVMGVGGIGINAVQGARARRGDPDHRRRPRSRSSGRRPWSSGRPTPWRTSARR